MAVPDTLGSTTAFSATARWLREKVLRVQAAELQAKAGRTVTELVSRIETPGCVLTTGDLDSYQSVLSHTVGDVANELITALASAHCGLETPCLELLRERRRQRCREPRLFIGVNMHSDGCAPLEAMSCSVLPAAHNYLRCADLASFASCLTDIAARHDGPIFLPDRDQGLHAFASLVESRRRDGGLVCYAGNSEPTRPGIGVYIDPCIGITSLADAALIAHAMGADQHERNALSWGLLLARHASQGQDRPGPLIWAELDGQGPQGYQAIIESLPAKVAALSPASDHIWSVTRRYLSQWHGHYVRTSTRIELNADINTGQPRAVPVTTNIAATTETLAKMVVIFDESALPGLPRILGCTRPGVYCSGTSIEICARRPESEARYWWLPTGVNARILCRRIGATHLGWFPVDLGCYS